SASASNAQASDRFADSASAPMAAGRAIDAASNQPATTNQPAISNQPATSDQPATADQRSAVSDQLPETRRILIACASPIARVARRIAVLAGRGVAVAQSTAALVVAGARAELRAVERREQTAAAHLTRDRRQRVLRGHRTGRRVLRRIAHARTGAAV